jgi:hypothetical protein
LIIATLPLRHLANKISRRKDTVVDKKTRLEEMILRYNAGESQESVAKHFGISPSRVWQLLKKAGVKSRPSGYKRLHNFNQSFFSSISTEPQAYWLGFIAADGHIRTSKMELQVGLSVNDTEHVKKFLAAIGSDHHIKHYLSTNSNTGRQHESVRVTVPSAVMIRDLLSLGLTPQKTTELTWPHIPDEQQPHFLRGYFDGDGCWIRIAGNRGGQCIWSVISSIKFLDGCQDYLSRTLSIGNKVPRQRRSCRDGIGDLTYGRRDVTARIYQLMYHDATVWLERKRVVADCFAN